ncbi:MAG TPA: hypothetical protein DCZ92_01605 [Elusimicrobia bacterium]|nr:MAG: hypothetical protein A2016_12310 [Elusimicrobia bacterium GWF2_62_30]HBA59522.1 hypothetical protein [Elusimicrobiota bacterium]
MKRVILAAACGLFAAGTCAAQNMDFSSADFTRQLTVLPIAAQAAAAKTQVSAPVKYKAARYVQVSGYVSLNGNGFMPTNGGFTSVTLNGWGTFRDSTGKVTSNNTYLNVNASMWVYPNQHVFQSVHPNVYVQFYKDGKLIGSTSMNGSISVSGWPGSSSFFSLSGSGYLSGSIYVQDEE